MKIAYCGYDFFSACLQTLLDNGEEVYRIFTVPSRGPSNSNQYIKNIANQFDVPVSEQRVDDATIKQLQDESCDVLVTAAYNYKIPSLESAGIRGVNVHPSLLPIGRGEWPLPWAILTEQQQSGITFHKLAQEYDAGDILLQRPFQLDKDETLETLSAKSQLLAKECVAEVFNDFDSVWQAAKPQVGEVSHWGIPSQTKRTIDWEAGIESIDRICRAFGKFGCNARFDGKAWLVYHLRAWKQAHNYKVGEVIHKTSTEMIVAASDGLVSLLYFTESHGH